MSSRTNLLVAIQHQLTAEQIQELKEMGYVGDIILLKDHNPDLFNKLSNCPDNQFELLQLAKELVSNGLNADLLRPIGSPAFNAVLDRVLFETHVKSLFSHSERISVDEPQADGSVVKKSVFKHIKFFKVDL